MNRDIIKTCSGVILLCGCHCGWALFWRCSSLPRK